MQAWHINSFGDASVFSLENTPDPQPFKNKVLIRVKAFGVNHRDRQMRRGKLRSRRPFPMILGTECVGEVINGGGTDLKPGTTVMAVIEDRLDFKSGTYAEKVLIPREEVFPIKSDLDWPLLAALPCSYLWAWDILFNRLSLQNGQSLFINVGSSAVGLAALNVAKAFGCKVIVGTQSEGKDKLLRKAGADQVLFDPQARYATKLKQLFPQGADKGLDLLGSSEALAQMHLALKPEAALVSAGNLDATDEEEESTADAKHLVYRHCPLNNSQKTNVLQKVCERVAIGAYRANIFQSFDFTELPQAHELLDNHQAVGKVVVQLNAK